MRIEYCEHRGTLEECMAQAVPVATFQDAFELVADANPGTLITIKFYGYDGRIKADRFIVVNISANPLVSTPGTGVLGWVNLYRD